MAGSTPYEQLIAHIKVDKREHKMQVLTGHHSVQRRCFAGVVLLVLPVVGGYLDGHDLTWRGVSPPFTLN